jgi:hypothetical protein
MSTIARSSASLRAAIVFTVLALGTTVPMSASNARSDNPSPAASIVAHLPVQGPVTQMFLQERAGKLYLYVDEGSGAGYTVVDVTKPAKARIVQRGAPGDSIEIVQGGIGLAQTTEGGSKSKSKSITSTKPTSESIKVMDLSDPTNPRTLETFTGVTSVLVDSKHNVFYLANDQGLWVLKSNVQRFAPERHKQPCTSEAAIQAMPPDCE